MARYNFGEKKEEYSPKAGKNVPVWQSPKYEQTKRKVIEMLESDQYKGVLEESDFWILMNATKSGKMAYTGLIISHNGCLKINDVLPKEKKFRPDCVSIDKEGYNGSLVFFYDCVEQGIFEVGEVNGKNCQNAYVYAMALKRLMDRVILKNSRLAYAGVYSDSEAEEFKKPEEQAPDRRKKAEPDETVDYSHEVMRICKKYAFPLDKVAQRFKLNSKSTQQDFYNAYMVLKDETGEE